MKKAILTFFILGCLLIPALAIKAADFSFDRNLTLGSRGEDVKALQEYLTDTGVYRGPVTGYFYSLTSRALKIFQKDRGLTATGKLNQATRDFINAELNAVVEDNSTAFKRNLAPGSSGVDVKALQAYLIDAGFYKGPVTGYFYSLTAGAVKKFQKARQLKVTGTLNLATRGFINEELVALVLEGGAEENFAPAAPATPATPATPASLVINTPPVITTTPALPATPATPAVPASHPTPTSTPVDTTSPSTPTNIIATVVSVTQISLIWTGSTDNVAVAGYKIFRNGIQIATSVITSFTDSGLLASSNYTYKVSAYDGAGNNSNQSASVSATTPIPIDTTTPSTPTGVMATVVSNAQISLIWTASTDNVAVAGYKIFRTGVLIATSSVTSFTDSGLLASTNYTYEVSAYDVAGNNSNQSASVSATTPAPTGSWSTTQGGGVGRTRHTSVLYNGKIYIWGGDSYSGIRMPIDIYSIDSNSWSSSKIGGSPRYEHTSVVYNGKIYFLGGIPWVGGYTQPVSMLDIYDIANDSWSIGANGGGTPRMNQTSVVYNGKIYSWGGDSGYYGNMANTVDIYDIASDTWTTGTSSPSGARNEHTSVLYNGKIYSWGGQKDGVPLNTMVIYDITNNSWTTGKSGGTPRSGHTSVVYDGKIFSWGGAANGAVGPLVLLNTLDIYDIASDSWSVGTMNGTARYEPTSVLYTGKMYLWGGVSIGLQSSDAVERSNSFLTTIDIYNP